MNWLKKLMLFTLLILVIQSKKKKDYNTKIMELEKKTYITTQDFNKLTSEHVAAR